MSKFVASVAAVGVIASSFASCAVPEVSPSFGHETRKQLFYAVVRGLQCEIRRAVKDQLNNDKDHRIQWLKKWSALMHLTFTFDTTLAFNPGVTFKTPMVDARIPLGDLSTYTFGQSYALGLGGNFSGQGTWVEDVEFFYPFNADFFDYPDSETSGCYQYGGFTIGGDLKLREWLDDVLHPVRTCAFSGVPNDPTEEQPPSVLGFSRGSREKSEDERLSSCSASKVASLGASKDNPIRTFAHKVTFVVTMEGSITPQWNLVRIESPLDSPLFRARHSNTGEVIITLGHPDMVEGGPKFKRWRKDRSSSVVVGPSQDMRDRDLSLQIGSAVRDALRR